MAVITDIATALPATTDKDDNVLRVLLLRDLIQAIPDATDPQTVDPTDPETGATAPGVAFERQIFWYEPDDNSSVHDGITVLVLIGGKRYIISDLADLRITSVLDKDLDTPPVSPTLGDSYLIPAAPQGAWATKTKHVATWTARGGGEWRFAAPRKGWVILVEDEDKHYKYSAAETWDLAFEPVSQSILAAHLNSSMRLDWLVQNQTTNAPPASVGQGAAYIIGSSPTGAWAGHTGKIGYRAASGTGAVDTIETPRVGDQAYDIALNNVFEWTGAAWQSQGGVVLGGTSVQTASGSQSTNGSGGSSSYSTSTPFTQSTDHRRDDAGITYTAKAAGNKLRFTYSFDRNFATNPLGIALVRGAEANAVDWRRLEVSGENHHTFVFEIAAADTTEQTYKVIFPAGSGGAADGYTIERRLFAVEEFAP